jgi:hypothetical protein
MLIADCFIEIMAHDLPKAYEPGAIESRWAEYWGLAHLYTLQPAGASITARRNFSLDPSAPRRLI